MNELRSLTETILNAAESDAVVFDSVSKMRDFYVSRTGKTSEELKKIGITTEWGLAISPMQAADCLVITPMRTVKFLRGVYKAILHARQLRPGQRVNIFYAGSGPYATLVTPFTSLFSPEELGFYILDINPECIDTVRQLYESMNALAYIRDFICDDATTCRLPQGEMHIVISETMQHALREEPQVAIMLNLIPQMQESAVFIPEEIRVSLKLLSPQDDEKFTFTGTYRPDSMQVGNAYVIGRYNCSAPVPKVMEVPVNYAHYTSLTMFTEIDVYGGEQLLAYNCSLNMPVKIGDVLGKPGAKIMFTYEMTNFPGFRHEWME